MVRYSLPSCNNYGLVLCSTRIIAVVPDLPNAAVALLGTGGAAATLLLVFIAVTSASSAEFIAVSSICTYDIYQTYINPRASGRSLINMAHISMAMYAIVLAAFSTGLHCK